MVEKLGLTYNLEMELKIGPEEIKNRIEKLKLETNIHQVSSRNRQLGFLVKQIRFDNYTGFEILKKGDFLDPFKSGRGTISAHISEKEN